MSAVRIVENSLLNLINIVVTLVLGICSSIVLTRYLQPEAYGQYQTAIWITATAVTVCGLGMAGTVKRYVAELDGRGQQGLAFRLVGTILKIQAGVGIVAVLVLVSSASLVAALIRQPTLDHYVSLAAIALGPQLLSAILQSSLGGFQRFASLTAIGIFKSVLMLTAAALAALLDIGIGGLLTCLIVVEALVAVVSAVLAIRHKPQGGGNAALPHLDLRAVAGYSASVFFTQLTDMLVWQRAGVFFLNLFSSSSEVGFYTLSASLAYLAVSTVPLGLSGVLVPTLAERWGAADQPALERIYVASLRSIALISFPICLGGAAVSRPFMTLIYGAQYMRAGDVLPHMLLSSTTVIMASVASSTLHAVGRADVLAKIGVGSAIANIALSLLLVPSHGAVGAALSSWIVRTLGAFVTFYAVGRLLSIRYQPRPFVLKALAAGLCGLAAYAALQTDPSPLALIASIAVGAAVYVVTALALGAVTRSERALISAAAAEWLHKHVGPAGLQQR